MKVITFFSEKGGVGKSSFSIMYASWLKYEHGLKVGVADYNDRISGYRKTEVANRNKLISLKPEKDIRPYDEEKAWPIVRATFAERNLLKREGSNVENATWLENEIRKGRLRDLDIVICDFPGSLTGNEFLHVYSQRMLSLIVVPTEKDQMTIESTIRLKRMLNEMNCAPYCCFINRAQLGLNSIRRTYQNLGPVLIKYGLPMLPDMVSYSERMLSIDKVDNLRSTFSFPDFNSQEFSGSRDLGINNLFIDVTRLLKESKDFRGTAVADLSFVDSLVKTDDGRQFKGSSFPQFEL